MKKLIITVCTCCFLPFLVHAQTMYVSPTGNASLNGQDINNPTTLVHAIGLLNSTTTTAVTIYLRGGTYTLTAAISLAASRSGTATNIKNLWAYPGDARPVLDFSGVLPRATTTTSGARGISFSPSYWYIKGIDIFNAPDNGIFMSGSYNKIENCSFSENQDTGLQLGGGASNNQIINCDSYYNVDPGQGNADGFAVKLDVGTGNSFTGCRAWQNSDDGWDGYMRPSDDVSTTLDNCWAFKNGYLKSGAVATSGNGNGFKMGGSDAKDLRHNMTLTRCVSFQNKSNGYDQNSNLGSMTMLNCTAYNNGGKNYRYDLALASGKLYTVKNSISAGTGSIATWLTNPSSAPSPPPVQATNTWSSGFTVSTADFQSIDPTAAYGARQADGSLPNMAFMHLATTSSLINRGTDVGLPFNGSAPDLGAFETSVTIPVTLTSFSATNKGSENILNWTTATEFNNAFFIVERSSNGVDFQSIGEVKGHGTTATPQYYTFTDKSPLWGLGGNYYRLHQIDFDGKETFSKTISINNDKNSGIKIKRYPSVITDILHVELEADNDATLLITDLMGKTILTKQTMKGFSTIRFELQNLPKGAYFLSVNTRTTSTVEKFVK